MNPNVCVVQCIIHSKSCVHAWHLHALHANYIIYEPVTRKLEEGFNGVAFTLLIFNEGAWCYWPPVMCINSQSPSLTHGYLTMNKLTLTLNLQVWIKNDVLVWSSLADFDVHVCGGFPCLCSILLRSSLLYDTKSEQTIGWGCAQNA